jgi:hypothetical protein
MNRATGIALLVVGLVLIIFGMNAAESLGSRLSQLLTGTPSDKAIWFLVAGTAVAVIGLIMTLGGRQSSA